MKEVVEGKKKLVRTRCVRLAIIRLLISASCGQLVLVCNLARMGNVPSIYDVR